MSKFADRLYFLRSENKLTQDGLCDILKEKYNIETNKSMISKYEKGIHEPAFTFIDYVADYFGVTTDWLMGRSDNKYYSDNNIDVRKVPVLKEITNEIQLMSSDNILSYQYTTDDADFCIHVFEDNMRVSGLKLNDLVFIKKQSNLENAQVGLFIINDKPGLYRLFCDEEPYVMLSSDTPWYKPVIMSKKDFKQITIIGRVLSAKVQL